MSSFSFRNLLGKLSPWDQSLIFLLLISGAYGLVVGIASSTWQASVESAQFLLGKVVYPTDSIEYELNASTFSLLNYFSAFFLKITDSEILSSIATSGLLGLIGFQVLAMAIFLFFRSAIYSFFGAIFLASNNLFGWGVAYPIFFMGTPHGYGRIALFFPLYGLLLMAFSKLRIGALLLGLAIGVHPTSGAWVIGCLGLGLFYQWRQYGLRDGCAYLKIVPFFIVGIGISFLAYFYQKYAFPVNTNLFVDKVESINIFNSYIKYWDYHRRKIDDLNFIFQGISLTLMAVMTSIFFLRKKFSNNVNQENLYLKFILISSFLSIPLVFIPSWFDAALFPTIFVSAMPGRFINFSIFLLSPLTVALIGVLLKDRRYFSYIALAVAILIILCIEFGVKSQKVIFVFSALTVTILFRFIIGRIKAPLICQIKGLVIGVMCLIMLFAPTYTLKAIREVRTKNFIHMAIANKPNGLALVTMHNLFFQVQQRMPALTPHLDGFVYLVNSGALIRLNNYAEEIFGISLNKEPPPSIKNIHSSSFEIVDYQALWMSRSCRDWERLSQKYGFVIIEVPTNIPLQLKSIAESRALRVYVPKCE